MIIELMKKLLGMGSDDSASQQGNAMAHVPPPRRHDRDKEVKVSHEENERLNSSSLDEIFEEAKEAWYAEDYEKAYRFFWELASRNFVEAYGYVGLACEFGQGVDQDEELMVKYYQLAIDAHDYLGVYRLGQYYLNNERYDEARELYERAIDGGWNTDDAYFRLGYIYENGLDVEPDMGKAISLYRQAGRDCDDAREALQRLGAFYELEDFEDAVLPESAEDMTPDELYQEAENMMPQYNPNWPVVFKYFLTAWEKGRHALAAHRVAQFYEDTTLPILNASKAQYYADQATELMLDQAHANPTLAFDIGLAYHFGEGCQRDLEKAKASHFVGISIGEMGCMWDLGRIAREERKFPEAFEYFRKAAEGGQGMAMYELGYCYEEGQGTTKDIGAAIMWYERCVKSQYRYAELAEQRLKILKES